MGRHGELMIFNLGRSSEANRSGQALTQNHTRLGLFAVQNIDSLTDCTQISPQPTLFSRPLAGGYGYVNWDESAEHRRAVPLLRRRWMAIYYLEVLCP